MLVAIDLETFLMSKDVVSPRPVCLSYYSDKGHKGIIAGDSRIKNAFLGFIKNHRVVLQNGKFDFGVMATHFPETIPHMLEALEKGTVHDTMIREQLHCLSTNGYVRRFSLANLVKERLDKDISKYKKGDVWRLRYSELHGKPVSEYPFGAKKYCILDVRDTIKVYQHQEETKKNKGPGSINTESLQVMAAFCLQLSTITGIHVDQEKLEEVSSADLAEYEAAKAELVKLSYAVETKTGIKKENKLIGEYLEKKYPTYVRRTDKSDSVAIGLNDLLKYPQDDTIVQLLVTIASLQKNCTTYYPNLRNGKVHPNYDILKKTGRTSSHGNSTYPSLNIQQQPRKEGVRECYIPKEGNVLISCDYSNLELCSVGQSCFRLFKESKMLERINAGIDLHSHMGSLLLGIDYEDFKKKLAAGDKEAKRHRTMAKPINLGIPGGMSSERISETAKTAYSVDMPYEDALRYRKIYMAEYPEIQRFFSYIIKIFGSDGIFSYSINNRFRNGCTYTTMANGFLMQSLSADGAKLAICDVTKQSYNKDSILHGSNIAAFIHDEILLETKNENLEAKMEALANSMLQSMSYVMPDVRLTCETSVMDRWRKDGPFLLEGKYSKETT